jgi:uncharacterized protein (TIGR00725 family)
MPEHKAFFASEKTIIAVIGGGQCTKVEAKQAETIGKELAKRGITLICGGLGGVMEAACRGAVSEGGITIGILPGDNTKLANPYVEIRIATGLGEARNLAIVKTAQAVIAVGGEYGTLSEIAFALKSNKPVIGLHTWSLHKKGHEVKSIIEAKDPVDAVEKAIKLAGRAIRG